MSNMVSELIDYIDSLNIYYTIDNNVYYFDFIKNTNSILFKTLISYSARTNRINFFIPNFPSIFHKINYGELDEIRNYIKKKYINI